MSNVQINRGAELPRKFNPLVIEQPDESGAERGQIVVMFAIFLIAMIGVLGLATDVGYAMAAKRSVQGAADSGALAGARTIARYTSTTPLSAQSDVTSVVQKNTFGSLVPTIKSCEYIGNNWGVVGTCNQIVPSNAAGARVKTRGVVKTWFIHVVPGAPNSVTVSGYAKARVQNAMKAPSDAPFIVCGEQTWDVTSNPTGNGPSVGTTLNLLSATSPMKINPAAIGRTFRINDTHLHAKSGVNCDASSNRFDGLADQTANAAKTAGNWFTYLTSGTAGSTRTVVNGASGCEGGTVAPYNCVMLLPIAKSGAPSGGESKLYVVGFAAFQITQVNATTHNATLLDDYIITGTGGDTWCRDCGGTVVIRLIW